MLREFGSLHQKRESNPEINGMAVTSATNCLLLLESYKSPNSTVRNAALQAPDLASLKQCPLVQNRNFHMRRLTL